MRPFAVRSSDISPLDWRKSSFSWANGECVEVAGRPDGFVRVRDSMNPAGGVLAFGRAQWNAFVDDVRNTENRG
jgi:hypothetical protein